MMKHSWLAEEIYRFLKGSSLNFQTGEPDEERIGKQELKEILEQMDTLSKRFYLPDKQRMWKTIYQHAVATRRKQLIRRWSTVAAVLVPVVLSVVVLLYLSDSRPSEQIKVAKTGYNRVQLFLNDGRVVEVQSVNKDSVVLEEGAGIFLDTAHSIRYTARQHENAGLVFNILRVPRCCEYHLVLADGTQVWLNSDSELRFPVDFTGEERRVYLKGEAYFQVAKNAAKPFRVEASEMVVEALGTGFDVNAYGDGGALLATLVEGSVLVSATTSGNECILTPGKQAVLTDHHLNIREVNVNEVTAWKDGRFVFSNMALEEISRQLERWYDVEIVFQDVRVRSYRFTGVMKRYNRLAQLIELIEETTDVKFQIDGRNIRICRK